MHQKTKATTDLNVCRRTETPAHFDIKILASFHADRWQLHSPNPSHISSHLAEERERINLTDIDATSCRHRIPIGREGVARRASPCGQCSVELCASHRTEYLVDCSEEDPMQPTSTACVFELDKSKKAQQWKRKINVHRASDGVLLVRAKLLTQTH